MDSIQKREIAKSKRHGKRAPRLAGSLYKRVRKAVPTELLSR